MDKFLFTTSAILMVCWVILVIEYELEMGSKSAKVIDAIQFICSLCFLLLFVSLLIIGFFKFIY